MSFHTNISLSLSFACLCVFNPAKEILEMVYYGRRDSNNGKNQGEFSKHHVHEKPRKRGFWASRFVEFCKRTDLHGFKYIVMGELTAVERSCWAVAVCLSMSTAAYFVVTAYRWYARNPIVTVIESTQGAIWDVPFPAVTICNLNTISRRAARTFANNLTLPLNVTSNSVFEILRVAPLLHSNFNTTIDEKKKLHLLQEVLELNKISIEAMFTALSPAAPCSHLVQRCMWKNTIYRCDQLFQQVFNTYNLCCSFNYFGILGSNNSKENTEGNIYKLQKPRRVASCGYQTALSVVLNTDKDDYYSSVAASQGALVFIDSAYNLPNENSPVHMVNPFTEVLIALSPARTYSTSGVKSFSPSERQCYYNDEIKVGEFTKYSLHNCVAYRKVELIKSLCECVPFFFPLKDYPRICDFKDLECLESITRPGSERKLFLNDAEAMNCLPECEHFDYPIEVAMGRLAKDVNLNGLPFFTNLNLENRSLLNVFFNDLVSTRYRRDVYLNWQNILAAFGGLLSLMLGFTLISGVDSILFFTLQLIYEFLPEHMYQTRPVTKASLAKVNEKIVNSWMENNMKLPHVSNSNIGVRKSDKFRSRY